MTKERKTNKTNTRHSKRGIFYLLLVFGTACVFTLLLLNKISIKDVTEVINVLSDKQLPAYITDDRGEVEILEDIPTYEEVDGGLFKDETTGLSINEGDYEDLGWSEIYNVSSPDAFRNDTIGKCIRAGNIYGSQCVSLARVFWWSYADRDVSTCGTGMAKGMMDCAKQNAGNDFLVFWSDSKDQIQAGDWLVFDGGQYGHIGMALGNVVNGYVALLGENQGGRECEGGGGATNIINISVKKLIGFYRPMAYIKPEPSPDPIPSACEIYEVKWGDTMGEIMLQCEGKVEWGEKMNDYASKWYSLKIKPNQSVLSGWNSFTGVGLYAGDLIEYREQNVRLFIF